MQTVVEWFRKQDGWHRSCNGNGMYWITPKGRYVKFPGGSFV
jgi:hypothetical protein